MLVAAAHALAPRVDEAVGSFSFARASVDWRTVIEDPEVDVVFIATPNMLHLELVQPVAIGGPAEIGLCWAPA